MNHKSDDVKRASIEYALQDNRHKYKAEDLKPGMIVAFSELSDVNEISIYLKASTMVYFTGDPVGEIVSVGYSHLCDDYEPEELVCITNHDDKDYYSMDDFYDLDELD